MRPPQNLELVELFDAAVGLSAAEQADFLAGVRSLDPKQAERLEALLAGDRAVPDHRLEVAAMVGIPRAFGETVRTGSGDGVSTVCEWGRSSRPSLDRLPGPGSVLCQYEIIRELGRGGMGAIYLARDTVLGRRVAIKLLLSADRHMTSRLVAEARTTAQCTHENIVVIHEVNEYQGNPFMVLEYLRGQSLRQLLERQTLPPRRALEIIVPVLRALICAHGMGIIHRDLKPENVMLTDTGTVKVLDFGIAKLLADQSRFESSADTDHESIVGRHDTLSRTITGALIGTLPYMSPEQMAGALIDHRADIWAVGIMLCEMVTGRHPLAPLSAEKLVHVADVDRPMPSMRELAPGLGELGRIIDDCLIKDVAARTPTVRQLLDRCEGSLGRGERHPMPRDMNPYAGLAAFQEADADRFFGRASEIASIAARLRNEPRITLVGPSGSGKSSLVRAGVIPALKRSGEGWDALVLRPGRDPVAALGRSLWQFLMGVNRSEGVVVEHGELTERLRTEPGFLGVTLRAHANQRGRRLLVFVDQFEEVYTLGTGKRDRSVFFSCLEGVADDASSPLRLILSMRSDFFDRVAEDQVFVSALTAGLTLLSPMGRDGLRQALTRPLAAVGHEFEDAALVDAMLDGVESTRGALPLLQFTAARLWDSRDRARKRLTRASYEAIGGISGTLARHADAVLTAMSAEKLALARAVFECLVTPERTRAIAPLGDLRDLGDDARAVEQVVHELANARLLAIETCPDGQGGMVEIVHDSLIEDWPTLRLWLDNNQEDVVFLTRLRTAAREWDRRDRSDGMLWRGEIEREARGWCARYCGEIGARERQYLDAIFALADRTLRRRRLVISGSMVLLVAALVVSVVVLVSLRRAEEATRDKAVELSEALQRETRERAKAEKAQELAEQARRKAALSAERLRQMNARAEREREQALQSEAAAKKAKAAAAASASQARRAESQARRVASQARKAEEQAREAEVRAREARGKALDEAAKSRRREKEMEALVKRAAGPIRRVLP